MPPLTPPPAATALTDEEIISIAIDAGYAVPENERHLAFGRAVVRAQLAKTAPSAIAQHDCGSCGYTADPCGLRREGPGPNPLRAPSTSPATDKDEEIRLLRKDLQQQRERNDELSHELVVRTVAVTPLGPMAASPAALTDERMEAAASIIAAHLLGQPQRDDVEWVAHSIRALLTAPPADQEEASQEVK
ncbi:hypothetical protein QO239_09945 [Cupriavidus taiwanensis]|uniref:hypothetical protein n=1 Tax=Cupriavidus taiwanensis TaxID=164546 RepID=UPI002541A7F0|nr:hypothetical protein [Cupriavidus taiwanensis]MDK3022912.1 hypothetical protein [Cupriavidus taiwanensis]